MTVGRHLKPRRQITHSNRGADLTTALFFQEPRWYPAGAVWPLAVPPALRAWLLDPCSLTRRLTRLAGGDFRVQVLTQRWQRPLPSEARLLAVAGREYALVRQVLLHCRGEPWVFARTVIPRSSFEGGLKRLAYLGARPLGAWLFADPSTRRIFTEVAAMSAADRCFMGVPFCDASAEGWGRRSVLSVRKKPILINEIFLPVCLAELGSTPVTGGVRAAAVSRRRRLTPADAGLPIRS